MVLIFMFKFSSSPFGIQGKSMQKIGIEFQFNKNWNNHLLNKLNLLNFC